MFVISHKLEIVATPQLLKTYVCSSGNCIILYQTQRRFRNKIIIHDITSMVIMISYPLYLSYFQSFVIVTIVILILIEKVTRFRSVDQITQVRNDTNMILAKFLYFYCFFLYFIIYGFIFSILNTLKHHVFFRNYFSQVRLRNGQEMPHRVQIQEKTHIIVKYLKNTCCCVIHQVQISTIETTKFTKKDSVQLHLQM